MKTRYRIYTEGGANLTSKVQDETNKRFDGYSLFVGTGIWVGVPETCLVVEIITDHPESGKVWELCHAIRLANQQDAVLVTEEPVKSSLIVGAGDGRSEVI